MRCFSWIVVAIAGYFTLVKYIGMQGISCFVLRPGSFYFSDRFLLFGVSFSALHVMIYLGVLSTAVLLHMHQFKIQSLNRELLRMKKCAHDFRSSLSMVEFVDPTKHPQLFHSGVSRLKVLSRRISRGDQESESALEWFNLNDCFLKLKQINSYELTGRRCHWIDHSKNQVLWIKAHSDSLFQLIENIYANAVDASEQCKPIRVTIGSVDNNPFLEIWNQGGVFITSRRLGTQKLCTNKPEGTGFGYWRVRERLSDWNAKLIVSTSSTRGTKVKIVFEGFRDQLV